MVARTEEKENSSEHILYISALEADQIVFGEDHKLVDKYVGEEHRWYTDVWYVIKDNYGFLYEFKFMRPNNEIGWENEEYFYEADPIPCYPVAVRTKLTKYYIRKYPSQDMQMAEASGL